MHFGIPLLLPVLLVLPSCGEEESVSMPQTGEVQLTTDPLTRTLDWLCAQQRQDGSFEGGLRATGLALLAFTSAGHTRKYGRYRDTVRTAAEYLETSVRRSGADVEEDPIPHLVASLSLIKLFGMTLRPAHREAAQKAAAMSWRILEAEGVDPLTLCWAAVTLCQANGYFGDKVDPELHEVRLRLDALRAARCRFRFSRRALDAARLAIRRELQDPRPWYEDEDGLARQLAEDPPDSIDLEAWLWGAEVVWRTSKFHDEFWRSTFYSSIDELRLSDGSWPACQGFSKLEVTAALAAAEGALSVSR